MLRRRKFGDLPDGTSVDVITLGGPGSIEANVLTYGCIIASLVGARCRRSSGECGPGLRSPRALRRRVPLLWRGRRSIREPHRTRAIRDRRPRASRVAERTAASSSRRVQGIRQARVGGGALRQWTAASYSGGRSADGEEGYPGAVDVQVTYTVVDHDLQIEYQAVADAPTHVNLTQHSYFNLRGTGDVLAHCLAINASTYLPVDESLIPTGELAPVANSPFDFQESTAIGLRLHAEHEQLKRVAGTTTPSTSTAWTRRWRWRLACSNLRAGGRSRSAPRSRDCSFIPGRWSGTAASAWSRSTIQIRRTARGFPLRCCGRASCYQSKTVLAFGIG